MIPATATRTTPKKPGWYWIWTSENAEPFIGQVTEGLLGLVVELLVLEEIVDHPDWYWVEVAPPDARWFKPMREEPIGNLPDPLF